MTFHHWSLKVEGFWTNLSNLGALGLDLHTELGNILSRLVSKFHELQIINKFLLTAENKNQVAFQDMGDQSQAIRFGSKVGKDINMAFFGTALRFTSS